MDIEEDSDATPKAKQGKKPLAASVHKSDESSEEE